MWLIAAQEEANDCCCVYKANDGVRALLNKGNTDFMTISTKEIPIARRQQIFTAHDEIFLNEVGSIFVLRPQSSSISPGFHFAHAPLDW